MNSIINGIISDLDKVFEDAEKWGAGENVDKLSKIVIKSSYVSLIVIIKRQIISMMEADKLNGYLDKLEESLTGGEETLSSAQQLTLLKILQDKNQNTMNNTHESLDSILDRLDRLSDLQRLSDSLNESQDTELSEEEREEKEEVEARVAEVLLEALRRRDDKIKH